MTCEEEIVDLDEEARSLAYYGGSTVEEARQFLDRMERGVVPPDLHRADDTRAELRERMKMWGGDRVAIESVADLEKLLRDEQPREET